MHLVGSVLGKLATDVLCSVPARIGPNLARIPDGETGERKFFIDWHIGIIAAARKQLEWISPDAERYPQLPRFAVRDGVGADDIELGPFGYAEWAAESFRIFTELKDAGRIGPEF